MSGNVRCGVWLKLEVGATSHPCTSTKRGRVTFGDRDQTRLPAPKSRLHSPNSRTKDASHLSPPKQKQKQKVMITYSKKTLCTSLPLLPSKPSFLFNDFLLLLPSPPTKTFPPFPTTTFTLILTKLTTNSPKTNLSIPLQQFIRR